MKQISILIVFLFFLTACGSSAPTLNPTEGARLLSGDYITTITAEDVANFDSLDDLFDVKGGWRLRFDDAGEIIALRDGIEIAYGNYTVQGDEVKVYVSSVTVDNGCLHQIGRFNWSLEENELRFTKIAGVCDAMDLILTSHPLLRQP